MVQLEDVRCLVVVTTSVDRDRGVTAVIEGLIPSERL